LYATVPHAPTKPSSASRGSVSRPRGASVSTPASASARSASAPAISRGRDIRSASTPAGTESRRNGSVCAVCSSPVSPAPAPRVGRGAKPPSESSAYVERLAQAVADEVDGEHGQREKEAGKEDDPERQLHVRLALGHDVAPRRDVGRRPGAEEGQVGLEQDGR